jgi:hypothetical protein
MIDLPSSINELYRIYNLKAPETSTSRASKHDTTSCPHMRRVVRMIWFSKEKGLPRSPTSFHYSQALYLILEWKHMLVLAAQNQLKLDRLGLSLLGLLHSEEY